MVIPTQYAKQIGKIAKKYKIEINTLTLRPKYSSAAWVMSLSLPFAWCKKVRAVLDVQYSGLVCAVILGNRSYLPSEQYQLFERLGVEHLLAVSGMHLTLFCGMFSLLAGRFVKRKSPRLLLSMGFVLFYMLLTGLGPSVSRAGIMLLLSYLAQLISRQADPPTSLGAAVFLMLLYNPFLAMNTSFQFSVCATIGVRILAEIGRAHV